MDESGSLDAIRAWQRQGGYREAAILADGLPCPMRARPEVAIARARARMRQGRINLARDALAEADPAAGSPGDRLLLALESASVRIYGDFAIREALQAADLALASSADAAIDPADRAEAERVHTRILLGGATYFEVEAAAARRAVDRLPSVAEALERAGRLDEALAAWCTHAERQPEVAARLEALAQLADHAVAVGRPAVAAEARVARAEQLLATGAPATAVTAELDAAARQFAACGHAHGPIDVRRVRAWLAIERERAGDGPMQTCLEDYERIDYPRGALGVLNQLSSWAHHRGDTTAADGYRRRLLELATSAGMELARDGFQFAQADLFMRKGNYAAAIELCRAALDAPLPAFRAASYGLLLASAHGFAGNLDAAVACGHRALVELDQLGAVGFASEAAVKLASDMARFRTDKMWDQAQALLVQWQARDVQRGDLAAAVSKDHGIAQIAIQRFLFSKRQRADLAWLEQADQALRAADRHAQQLPAYEAARRSGEIHMLRAQLCQARGDTDGVERALRDALARYEEVGLEMEAANARYLIGTLRLNLAIPQLLPHFGEAESKLSGALAYYERAGMRAQSADASVMLAQLYVNAAVRVTEDVAAQLLDAALQRLAVAEGHGDAMRRDYSVGSILEALHGKRAVIENNRRVYELALGIVTGDRPDAAEAWRWCQRAKARALADAIGNGLAVPARVLGALSAHPGAQGLLDTERELAGRLGSAPPAQVPALRTELAALRVQMAAEPALAEHLELTTGATLEVDDAAAILDRDPRRVCVDWVAAGDRLFVLVLRSGGAPQLEPVAPSLAWVRAFVAKNLAPMSFRSTLSCQPELLRALDPLIAPLGALTARDELLVLSPTGPLHALPLHALELDGEPLLARNPIVYCPSLGVMRQCVARRGARPAARTAAIFGDPSGDRAEAAEFVTELAARLGTTPRTRGEVTRAAFATQVSGRDIVHFHGHARHDPIDPLQSHLVLAGRTEPLVAPGRDPGRHDKLTARDVFALTGLRAELVTLAACESAATVIATGDEPLGLIPAFLYAGARSVLATLWPVRCRPAVEIMRRFYLSWTDPERARDKAQCLREAMLAVRATSDGGAPYDWAPFVLYGDWD